MSLRYKGAVISATPPTTTGGNSGTAPGAWTLQQQLQAQAAGNWPPQPVWYVEDVFSTWLYTGNGSTQTITNGIDLAGKGGLVWTKGRSAITDNMWFDTARGVQKELSSNKTNAEATNTLGITAFGATGYSMGSDGSLNGSGTTYASWTFRKQPKFFDVVTYTGNGATNRQIAHNLGSTPGCIIVKCTSVATNWVVYHRNLTNANYCLILNSTTAQVSDSTVFGTAPTDTVFTVARTGVSSNTNQNGATYVAYLFAHDAGGFGLTGTDNVISCGSFTTDGSGNATVNLGYEPQWVLVKPSSTADNWFIFDNMRGFPVNSTGAGVAELKPNSSDAEATAQHIISPTATGFAISGGGGFGVNTTCIYIAIRRGPMKVPTDGTKVFSPITSNSVAGTANITGFPVDLQVSNARTGNNPNNFFSDRLRGASSTTTSTGVALNSTDTTAEDTSRNITRLWDNAGFQTSQYFAGSSMVYWNFRRAPGFFDEVCYTGTGATIALNHNLAAVPELMIVKSRGAATGNWVTYTATYGSGSFIRINSASGNNTGAGNLWGATTPTSSLFYVGEGGAGGLSVSGNNYVAYLFASCPGVSKVGSYTGTGTTKQINCGFTAGARFVLIKRTDSTGDWYVWDSARGIVAGNDPYLLLNSTAAEVTSTDYVDTYAAGFEISSTAPAAINANGGTFIYLAIA